MKEATVAKAEDGKSVIVKLQDVAVPKPGPDEVLIKVIVSGSNPKDWKMPFWQPAQNGKNTGDDIAGTIAAVGSDVVDFHVGDRVAAFHKMTTPSGSYAEYAIAPAATTLHLPASISYEQAATIPLASLTAVVGVFGFLGLPEPWNTNPALRRDCEGGVVVYGASSAVGGYVVKLLKRADIHPIICVAGKGASFVEDLIEKDKGDIVIDYRKGGEAVVEGIKAGVTKGKTLRYAYDAVSDFDSWHHICKVLDTNGGHLTTVLPGKEFPGIPEGIVHTRTQVGTVHNGPNKDLGHAWFKLIARGLQEGWFAPHPHTVVKGGLNGVGEGLNNLMTGNVSATKFVFRVEETEGAGQDKP